MLARVKRFFSCRVGVLRLGRFWFGGSGILGGGREVVDVVQADVAHISRGFGFDVPWLWHRTVMFRVCRL